MYIKIIIFLFLPLYLLSQENKLIKKLSFNSNMHNKMKYKNSESALKNWVKKVTVNSNLIVTLDIYDDNNKMLNDYFNNKIDMLVFSPFDYITNIDKFKKNTSEYWYLKKDMKHNYHKKYLIVNNSINSMLDLNDKKIMINSGNKISKLFLEKKYLEKIKKSPKKILKNIEFVNSNSILLKTYFGTYDAAIIDSYEYETMIELNPSILKKIKILEESPRIFNDMIISFSKTNKDSDMNNFQQILKKFLEDKKKRELFNLLKIKTIKTNQNNLKDLEDYYTDYLKVKKKYDK